MKWIALTALSLLLLPAQSHAQSSGYKADPGNGEMTSLLDHNQETIKSFCSMHATSPRCIGRKPLPAQPQGTPDRNSDNDNKYIPAEIREDTSVQSSD